MPRKIHRAPYIFVRKEKKKNCKMKSFVLISVGIRHARKSFHVGLLEKHISSLYIFGISTTISCLLSPFFSFSRTYPSRSKLFLDCSQKKWGNESFPTNHVYNKFIHTFLSRDSGKEAKKRKSSKTTTPT